MRKIRLATVSLFCTLLFLSCGVSASAFAVEFDEQTGMEPVLERAVGIAPVSPQGTYIASGASSITVIGNKKVHIGAETSCYRTMSKVNANVYLYKKSGATVTSGDYNATNTSYVSGGKDVSVAAGYYYVRGGHNVYKDGKAVETAMSCTSTIYVG